VPLYAQHYSLGSTECIKFSVTGKVRELGLVSLMAFMEILQYVHLLKQRDQSTVAEDRRVVGLITYAGSI